MPIYKKFFIVTHIVDELQYANNYTDGRFGLCRAGVHAHDS